MPKLGSLIITHDLDGEIAGLKEVPREERPPVAPVFFAFRVMVGIGLLMLALVVWSALLWRRGRLMRIEARAARVDVDVAGRLHRRARGLVHDGDRPPAVCDLRPDAHREAASAVDAGSVLTSLVVFGTVYLFVFIAGTYYLFKLLRKGPQPVDEALRHPEDKTPAAAAVGTGRAVEDAG